MRNPGAYYLLLLYATVMLQPLLPIARDTWDHAFAEAEHIATVHAKYGANHLEKELAACANDANSKNQNSVKVQQPCQVHVLTKIISQVSSLGIQNTCYNTYQIDKISTIYLTNLAPPPKFIL